MGQTCKPTGQHPGVKKEIDVKQFNPDNYMPILKLMYRNAVISSDLRYLIGKILLRLIAENWQEAFRLSQLKSRIGPIPTDRYNLWENSTENQKLFQGNDVYVVLDSLTFDLRKKAS